MDGRSAFQFAAALVPMLTQPCNRTILMRLQGAAKAALERV